MTRETRIALLVGLAIIILFGLVLGQRSLKVCPVSGQGVPASAPAQRPGGELTGARLVQRDRPVRPPQRRVAPRRAARPAEPSRQQIPIARHAPTAPGRPVPRRLVGSALPARAPAPAGPLAVRPSPRPAPALPSPPVLPSASVRPPAPPVRRTYLAAPGDTLIAIARKVYGPGHEDEYVRIFEANRDRLPDASTVRAGQELVIPPLQGASGPPAAARADRSAVPARPRHFREVTLEALQQELSSPRTRGTYMVQPGDCLTGIARQVMGDDSRQAVQRLFETNRDRIHDPDSLPVGVVLRIPG